MGKKAGINALHLAAAEARKWMGATSPNPPVGAIALNAAGDVLAVAAHQRAGEAHAETKLIEHCHNQNILSQVHTLYVTLEPCNHHGRTPPCTEAIIQSGIKHVVIGTRDPNPSVAGGGAERLRQASIDVFIHTHESVCQQLIHAFAFSVQTGKPWITVKRAIDEKGSMLPPLGQKVFTSPSSLKLAHQLRKKADGLITGSGTILADTPLFTVRHVPDYANKRRWLAILDRRGRVSDEFLKLAEARGLDAHIYQDIHAAIDDLARKGARDVLVEAGPQLSQFILDSHLETMSVTIHKGTPDRVDVDFNQNAPILFERATFDWDSFLPH